MINTVKKAQVDSIKKVLDENPNFMLIKIGKTTHQGLESLRKELRKNDSKVKVIKNTLFEKSVNKFAQKKPLFRDLKKSFFPLKETSALITLGNRWNEGLKTVFDYVKKDNSLSFKMALLDNTLYDADKTSKIAQLPSREELLGKIIGSMKSPMSKFVYSLKFNTNKFVYILQTKSKN